MQKPLWDSLTEEKSLAAVYFKTRKIPHSKFNFVVTSLILIGLVGFVYPSDQPTSEMRTLLLKWAESSLGFTLNVLGFLLAGFTIFATLSKPELLLEMHKHIEKKSGLSYLKYNLFSFVRVFIYYLVFVSFCIAILLFGQDRSPVVWVLNKVEIAEIGKPFVVKLCLVILGTAWMALLLSLKSFVFNILHTVMTSLQWEGYRQDEAAPAPAPAPAPTVEIKTGARSDGV